MRVKKWQRNVLNLYNNNSTFVARCNPLCSFLLNVGVFAWLFVGQAIQIIILIIIYWWWLEKWQLWCIATSKQPGVVPVVLGWRLVTMSIIHQSTNSIPAQTPLVFGGPDYLSFTNCDILSISGHLPVFWAIFCCMLLLFPSLRTRIISTKFELGQAIRFWHITFLLLLRYVTQ